MMRSESQRRAMFAQMAAQQQTSAPATTRRFGYRSSGAGSNFRQRSYYRNRIAAVSAGSYGALGAILGGAAGGFVRRKRFAVKPALLFGGAAATAGYVSSLFRTGSRMSRSGGYGGYRSGMSGGSGGSVYY